MEKLDIAERALSSLGEVLQEPYSVIVRDATIQRFEYSGEAVWKAVREWLQVNESIEENHPRGCYRALYRIGKIEEDLSLLLLAVVEDRNRTSHAYIENVAAAVFEKIPEHYRALQSVLNLLKVS
jgi:nucleotidyltransferase substrate binding protein (TIGR01987 family)